MTDLATARAQAADWYERTADRETCGACQVLFRKHAQRVRNGDADHRLDEVLAGQAEYDAEQVRRELGLFEDGRRAA